MIKKKVKKRQSKRGSMQLPKHIRYPVDAIFPVHSWCWSVRLFSFAYGRFWVVLFLDPFPWNKWGYWTDHPMITSDCVVSAVDFGMKRSAKNPKVDRNFKCVNIADVWTDSSHTAKIYWCWNMLGKDKVITGSNSFRFVTLEGLSFPFTAVLCPLLLLMLLSVPWCRSSIWEQTSKGSCPEDIIE